MKERYIFHYNTELGIIIIKLGTDFLTRSDHNTCMRRSSLQNGLEETEGGNEISYVLCKFCESHLLRLIVIVEGVQLRFSKTSPELIKNSRIENGTRTPILDLFISIHSLHLGQSEI